MPTRIFGKCLGISKIHIEYFLKNTLRAISSVGRAAHLHCEGREFESLIAHKGIRKITGVNPVVFLIASKLLCLRTLVRGGVMFFSPFLAKKTDEPGSRTLSRFLTKCRNILSDS